MSLQAAAIGLGIAAIGVMVFLAVEAKEEGKKDEL